VSGARLGWLGGTFDPIHNGHLDVARAARTALDLETVYLVPAGVPSHRPAPQASSFHRLAMARLAAETEPWLRVSDIELTADGPSYTMDTLNRLEAQGVDLESLFIVTGADAFAEILSWKAPIDLLNRCSFAVVSRPGFPATLLRQKLPSLAPRMFDSVDGASAPRPGIFLVDAPTAAVASTEVRAQAASSGSLAGMVPDSVATYIERHELYSSAKGVA
jgi:nicotinate-nucleotide adenylyltransferase